MTIQYKIAQALITQAANNPLNTMLDGKTVQQVCHFIFHSFRGNEQSAKGMRLSDIGLNLLKAFFKSHTINLPAGYVVTYPHLIYLDRVSAMPYWIDDKCLTTFDSELGMMLRLVDDNIQSLIDSRFRLTSGSNKIIKD